MPMLKTPRPPQHPCVHVRFDAGPLPKSAVGVSLTIVAPADILCAARRARRKAESDWVLWAVDALPMSERRAASFVVSLSRLVPGRVWVVETAPSSGRAARIFGHLSRCGCESV